MCGSSNRLGSFRISTLKLTSEVMAVKLATIGMFCPLSSLVYTPGPI